MNTSEETTTAARIQNAGVDPRRARRWGGVEGLGRAAGCRALVLFHCVSAYPSPVKEMNVRAVAAMKARYRLPVGLSDHSPGFAASAAAITVVLGGRRLAARLNG